MKVMNAIDKSCDQLQIRRSVKNLLAVGFWVLLLIGLTYQLVSLSYDVFFEKTVPEGGLFWVIVIALICLTIFFLILRNLVGEDILVITRQMLTIRKKAVFIFYKSQIPTKSITNVDIIYKGIVNDREQYCLEFSTAKKKLHFAAGEYTATLHKWLNEIRDFIEGRYDQTLKPAESAPSIKSESPLETYMRQQAEEEREEAKKGFAAKTMSWFAAFVWTAVGIIWNIAIICTVIRVIADGKWLVLIFLIPFMAAGVFLGFIAYTGIEVFISESINVFRRSRRRGREPGYASRISELGTEKERLLLPGMSGCILLQDNLEYRGELNIQKEDDKFYVVFSTCLADSDVITDYLKIPVREITAVSYKGGLTKKTVIVTIQGREYVFRGAPKMVAEMINTYSSLI